MFRKRPDVYQSFPPGELEEEYRARLAEAERWERAAQMCANTFWFWTIVAGLVWWAWRWWALVPTAIAVLRAANAIGATLIARRLSEPPQFTEPVEQEPLAPLPHPPGVPPRILDRPEAPRK